MVRKITMIFGKCTHERVTDSCLNLAFVKVSYKKMRKLGKVLFVLNKFVILGFIKFIYVMFGYNVLQSLIPNKWIYMRFSRESVQGHCWKCILCGTRGVAAELWEGDGRLECWSHFVHPSKWGPSFLGW